MQIATIWKASFRSGSNTLDFKGAFYSFHKCFTRIIQVQSCKTNPSEVAGKFLSHSRMPHHGIFGQHRRSSEHMSLLHCCRTLDEHPEDNRATCDVQQIIESKVTNSYILLRVILFRETLLYQSKQLKITNTWVDSFTLCKYNWTLTSII